MPRTTSIPPKSATNAILRTTHVSPHENLHGLPSLCRGISCLVGPSLGSEKGVPLGAKMGTVLAAAERGHRWRVVEAVPKTGYHFGTHFSVTPGPVKVTI